MKPVSLIFPRPSGLNLRVRRNGSTIRAELVDSATGFSLTRAACAIGSTYLFPDSDRHFALTLGTTSDLTTSFDVTPLEAECIRESLGIGQRPQSPSSIVRDVMLSHSAALMGAQA